MPFDKTAWKFPKEQLRVHSAFLCVKKDENDKVYTIGFRLECEPLLLPNINWSYEKEKEEMIELGIDLERRFQSVEQFANQKITPGLFKRIGEGSVYLFGAHNPVDWYSIQFGALTNETLPAVFDLGFDFDAEGRIGGRFRIALPCNVRVEKRWELSSDSDDDAGDDGE